MTYPKHHRPFARLLLGMTALLVELAITMHASAAISHGPTFTNAAASEQQRILQFFQAEQSHQEQLKVGRERYNQKQVTRARTIATMAAELQARQQTVVIQPVAAADANASQLVSGPAPWLTLAALSVGVGAIGLYLNRQRAQDASSRKR